MILYFTACVYFKHLLIQDLVTTALYEKLFFVAWFGGEVFRPLQDVEHKW